jgi:cell division protein FtsX
MISTLISYITVITVTVVLGGVFYLIRHDVREAAKKKETKKHEEEIDTAVKAKRSLVAAASARNKRNRVRE